MNAAKKQFMKDLIDILDVEEETNEVLEARARSVERAVCAAAAEARAFRLEREHSDRIAARVPTSGQRNLLGMCPEDLALEAAVLEGAVRELKAFARYLRGGNRT